MLARPPLEEALEEALEEVARLAVSNESITQSTPARLVKNEPMIATEVRLSHEVYEKNFVPFEHRGQLLIAYSIEPHRVYRLDRYSGTVTEIASSSNARLREALSAADIWIHGYLYMHRQTDRQTDRQTYTYRHTCTYVYMCVYTSIHITYSIYIYIYTHTHKHTHTHTYTYTYTCTHIHTYI